MNRAAGAAGIAAGVAGIAAGMAWAVRGRSSGVFGPSLWRGTPGRKALAITFDDGPSPDTIKLLGVLAEYGVRATFFQIGRNALRHPEIAQQVTAAGHEIGNHSQTHPNFALKSRAFIRSEFSAAQSSLASVTGRAPTLLRAPFGVRWPGFGQMQKNLGLSGVMWSVLGLDWKLSPRSVERRIVSRVKDGGIICLHDGRGTLKDPCIRTTLEAVRGILPCLLKKGYHFETVTQLLWPMN